MPRPTTSLSQSIPEMKKRHLIAALTLVGSFAGSSLACAEIVALKSDLQSSSEVPPTTAKGHGALEAEYDTTSKVLRWKVTYADLTGPANAAHFHGPAPIGRNAGVQVPIDSSALASPIQGQATLNDAQENDLLTGKWYFNVHTAQNAGGEIRGQVQRVVQ